MRFSRCGDLEISKFYGYFDEEGHWAYNPTDEEGPTAEDMFWDKLDYANLRPIDANGNAETPQAGYFYHPESGSWINTAQYQTLRGAAINAGEGSGMFINGLPEFAQNGAMKQSRMGDNTSLFYMDSEGRLHYADTMFDGADSGTEGLLQQDDLSTPKTVNDIVHAWMCQQIQQQAVNNPQDFQLSEGVPNPVVPVTANGVVPIDSLLAQTPNDVHPRSTFATGSVQETDALARRRAQGAPYRESRGGLASDEVGLGGGRWWSGTQELKQKIMDVANAPGLWPVSAVGKLLTMPLGGFGKQDKAIRRIRQNYNRDTKIANETKRQLEGLTRPDGEPMQYLSDGESQARKEDHETLKRHFTEKQKQYATEEKTHNLNKNPEGAAKAAKNKLDAQANHQDIYNLDVGVQSDWDKINAKYDNTFGGPQVQQAMAPPQGQSYPNMAQVMKPAQSRQDTFDDVQTRLDGI